MFSKFNDQNSCWFARQHINEKKYSIINNKYILLRADDNGHTINSILMRFDSLSNVLKRFNCNYNCLCLEQALVLEAAPTISKILNYHNLQWWKHSHWCMPLIKAYFLYIWVWNKRMYISLRCTRLQQMNLASAYIRTFHLAICCTVCSADRLIGACA